MLSNSLPSSAVSYHGSAVWTAMQARRWRSHPGKPLAAGCKAASRHAEVVRGTHDTPQADCTCGVYATKSFDHLHRTGYDLRGICGAVWLWGTVVEHKFGWRAQFAYPKSFCLTSDTLPFTLAAIQSRLETLIPYSTDIFVASPAGNLPLWTRGSGYEQAGLDYLVEVRKQGFERRRRILKRDDRVAVIGRGIAIVRMIYEGQVCAVLSNQTVLEASAMSQPSASATGTRAKWTRRRSLAIHRSASRRAQHTGTTRL